MSKRLLYLSIYLSIYLSSSSQINLVPNYSFEDSLNNNCSIQMGISNSLTSPSFFVKNWGTYQFESPDYYNICANPLTTFPYPNPASIPYNCDGYQSPHTGNAYIGIGLYQLAYLPDSSHINSERAAVKLKQSLKANTCYYGEFYMSFSNINAISINQMGMLFTQNDLTNVPYIIDNALPYQIQWDTTTCFTDTLNWVKISGQFIAQGGEEYLTIGNIRDGAHLKKKFVNTSFVTPCNISDPHRIVYVYIDDVSLYELPNHTGTKSYTLCAGESLLLGDTVSLPVLYQWSLNGVVVDTTKNITVASSASASSSTLTYVLQTKHCTIQTQTITVVVDDGCNPPLVTEALEVPNVFTPNGDGVNDSFEFLILNAEYAEFKIYNRWGNVIKNLELNTKNYISWDGRTTSGIECNAGVYFYVLEYTDASGDLKKKNGYISLIR